MATSSNNVGVTTMPVNEITDVILIGCGGTGSILAEHLCRMIRGFRLDIELTLWDGDTVEAANVTRQNFYPHEVGGNKAEALALRLAGQFGMTVGAVNFHFAKDKRIYESQVMVITATDTLASRRLISDCHVDFWLDVGNELDHGQAVLGTTHDASRLRGAYWNYHRLPYARELPDIAALNPAILKARKAKSKAGCAQQPFAQQGFGVNAQAALAAASLAREVLVDGHVKTAAIYFNVSDGRMAAQPITKDMFRPWKHKPKNKEKVR